MLIKHGRIDVVQMLRNFPRTFHIASSFSVDVMRASVSHYKYVLLLTSLIIIEVLC